MANHPLLAIATIGLFSSIARADFPVSGVFKYEKRTQIYSDVAGVPCWGQLQELPIRYATIRVFDAATNTVLLDNGHTDANGYFFGTVPSGSASTISVFVRCYAHISPGPFGAQEFKVTDATMAEYAVKSNLYRNWNTQQPLNFGTVVAHGTTGATGIINHPFSEYDNMVWMLSYFESMSGFHPTVPLAVVWPDAASYYDKDNHRVYIAYVGSDNDSTQLHEMGHYIHYSYGGATFPGTPDHYLNDSNNDPQMAFGEGLATLLEGLIRKFRGDNDPGYYAKCEPTASGTSMGGYRFEEGVQLGPVFGEGSESAVAMALWDIADTTITSDGDNLDDDPVDGSFLFQELMTGEELLWQSLLWVLPTHGTQVLEDMWNGFFVPVDWGHHQELLSTLTHWGMYFNNDVWEPDNTPEAATFLPISTWSPIHTLYYAAGSLGAPGSGDSDFFWFSPTVGQQITVRTTYPNNDCYNVYTDVEPYIRLRKPNGTIAIASDDGGGCGGDWLHRPDRNAGVTIVPDTGGPWTIEVKAGTQYGDYRRTGSYQVMWQ